MFFANDFIHYLIILLVLLRNCYQNVIDFGKDTAYLDGKPTYLSGDELMSLLKSTPATNADKIDSITQPSARHDAAGNSGLIVNASYLQVGYEKDRLKIFSEYKDWKITHVHGDFGGNTQQKDSSFTTNYFHLFPTIALQYGLTRNICFSFRMAGVLPAPIMVI